MGKRKKKKKRGGRKLIFLKHKQAKRCLRVANKMVKKSPLFTKVCVHLLDTSVCFSE